MPSKPIEDKVVQAIETVIGKIARPKGVRIIRSASIGRGRFRSGQAFLVQNRATRLGKRPSCLTRTEKRKVLELGCDKGETHCFLPTVALKSWHSTIRSRGFKCRIRHKPESLPPPMCVLSSQARWLDPAKVAERRRGALLLDFPNQTCLKY